MKKFPIIDGVGKPFDQLFGRPVKAPGVKPGCKLSLFSKTKLPPNLKFNVEYKT